MRARHLLAPAIAAAALIAGCGGSNNSDTAHIKPPPDQSQTLTFTATSTTSNSTTTPTATIVTPTSGPLSTEPKITVPKTAAPKTLVKKDLVTGTGALLTAADSPTVNYVGALYSNGKVFDASWKRNQTYPVGAPIGTASVIKGWQQGLVGMRVGGRRELIIPPSLGYKSTPQPGIPANSPLIFVVDLLALTPGSGSTGASGPTGATVAAGALGSTGSTGTTGATGAGG
ncbi:MAG: FKBP-type peptidyl-prolyl cis-trans isomerase [Solirubrobacteraceae bacterium]